MHQISIALILKNSRYCEYNFQIFWTPHWPELSMDSSQARAAFEPARAFLVIALQVMACLP
jgi:hypothetical protein